MSDRLDDLENQIASLRADLKTFVNIHQYLGGQNRAMENTVLALVASHPRPDLLAPVLNEHLSRTEAGIVAESRTEEHLQGFQEAQKLLLLALDSSYERYWYSEMNAPSPNLSVKRDLRNKRGFFVVTLHRRSPLPSTLG